MLLSMLVYASLVMLGMTFFHAGLTSALDEELTQLSQEILPSLDYEGDSVRLTSYPRTHHGHHRSPLRLLATIQIFDKDGKLLQEVGTKGVDTLLDGTVEINSGEYARRSMTTPLISDGKKVGYLQVQLTTKLRDAATRQFGMTMAVVAPMILLALGISGFFFAGKAAEPIEETMNVLRRFVADASHELGTPIAIIQAATENLADQLADTPHSERLGIIARTTDRMSRLVQDLMLLAKVDAPQQVMQRSAFNLDVLMKNCIEEFADRFKDKNVTLTTGEIVPTLVFGNQDSLHRVITNLIENALRYTNEGGNVTVSLKQQARLARMTVEDTGCGVPPESLPYLFDRFYRVDKSRSRAGGGSGLGLSIVKAIVQSHRGAVEVSSEFGKGSKFSVILPVMSGFPHTSLTTAKYDENAD
jgi:signal transduction histidine kinase